MIAQIDQLSKTYINSISQALDVHNALSQIDDNFKDLKHVPTTETIDEMVRAAHAAINERLRAQHALSKDSSVTVHGDYVSVGDIIDSDNVQVGKDLKMGRSNEED